MTSLRPSLSSPIRAFFGRTCGWMLAAGLWVSMLSTGKGGWQKEITCSVFVSSSTYFVPVGPGYLSWYSYWVGVVLSWNRIPLGARFSAPIRTGHGAHPASYKMGTGSLSRG
jgi:hypothetical protein